MLKDEFRIMPMNTQIAQGKTAILQCSPPKGRPEPIVYWLHDGKPIDLNQRSIGNHNHHQNHHNHRFRLDGTNLIINDVMKDDQGQYQCIAKNMIGIRESPAITLKVLGKFFLGESDRLID